MALTCSCGCSKIFLDNTVFNHPWSVSNIIKEVNLHLKPYKVRWIYNKSSTKELVQFNEDTSSHRPYILKTNNNFYIAYTTEHSLIKKKHKNQMYLKYNLDIIHITDNIDSSDLHAISTLIYYANIRSNTSIKESFIHQIEAFLQKHNLTGDYFYSQDFLNETLNHSGLTKEYFIDLFCNRYNFHYISHIGGKCEFTINLFSRDYDKYTSLLLLNLSEYTYNLKINEDSKFDPTSFRLKPLSCTFSWKNY